MPTSIINIADVSLEQTSPDWAVATGHPAEDFAAKTAAIGARIGARKLGYNITAVPPGKRAAPFHNHPAKEEMFFVLQGSGEVRIGETRHPIRTGDVIACPAGGKETAHQLINTGTEELRYLAVSTQHCLEMAQYPDSGKFAVAAMAGAGTDGTPQRAIFIGDEDQQLKL